MIGTPTSLPAKQGLRATDWPCVAPTLLAVACFALLATALIAEFGFGLEPCSLCRYQQGVYAVAGVIAVAAWLARNHGFARCGLVASCAAVLAAGSIIAFYHVGVEQHWWGADFCAGGSVADLSGLTLDAVRSQLGTVAEKPCDLVDWTVFGLSAATYNVGLFAVLAVAAVAAIRTGKPRA